jgi:dTDP-4-amino-4,6-dideoxygalactose transaminase
VKKLISLQSLKNMTTLGEGGFLTTNNDQYAEMARTLRTSHGTSMLTRPCLSATPLKTLVPAVNLILMIFNLK